MQDDRRGCLLVVPLPPRLPLACLLACLPAFALLALLSLALLALLSRLYFLGHDDKAMKRFRAIPMKPPGPRISIGRWCIPGTGLLFGFPSLRVLCAKHTTQDYYVSLFLAANHRFEGMC